MGGLQMGGLQIGSLQIGAALVFSAAVAASLGACGDSGRDAPPGSGAVVSTGATAGQGASGSSKGGAGGDGGGGGMAQGGSSSQGAGMPSAEDCYDGIDNDQNGDTDCSSPDVACAAICADSCAAPKTLSDPSGSVVGDTTEHANLAAGSSCAALMSEHGPGHVYEISVVNDGMLEARLSSDHDLSLSIRTECDDASNELACSERVTGTESPYFEYVKVAAAPGDKRFIVVEGYSLLEYGSYELEVSSREIICGDAIVDFPEECDDANTQDNDGCDAFCKLEASETEPNNSSSESQNWQDPWFASISDTNDEDWVWFIVGNNYSIVASTLDLGSGNCSLGLMDTAISLYSDAPVTEIASDDDGGDGLCARVSKRGLTAGTYFLRTMASPTPKVLPPFSYYLFIEMDECGNGMIGGAEECDDNNTMNGDGCSSICETEIP
jgi:cysteine-rich repeat protein